MSKYSAIIFDLDGTIVDDEKYWHRAFQNVADRNNIQYSKFNVQWPIPGRALEDSWRVVVPDGDVRILASETRDEFREIVENEEVLEPREGFDKLVEFLKEKGYLIGLCTSSFWEVADLLLSKMGLFGIFDAMTTGEEVTLVKPDPEIYLLTCQKLGVEPEEVLVFEDSEAGIESAKTAGCEVVKVGEGWDFTAGVKYLE